ncbi:MAG: ABC transporter permease, partial [Candidatus Brockarchaeota archaeon]|nr:ABC transporter permease [Candidatus Brockarchaeota archaeon]
MSAFASILERDIRLFLVDKVLLVMAFANFCIDLFVTGVTLGRLVQGFNYFLYLAPGANMITATAAAFQAGRWIFREKYRLRTKPYLASLPVGRGTFVAARMVAWTIRSLVTALPGTMVICVIYAAPTSFIFAVVLTTLFSMGVVGISMSVATVAGSLEAYATGRSITSVYFSFLSTTFYPETSLPSFLWPIVMTNPMTWTVEAFRSLPYGVSLQSLLSLAAVSS